MCGIVVAILKMATGRNFPMSLRFKNFEMFAILKMAAKIRYKKWAVKIQHFPISSKFDMWTSLSTHISNFDAIGQC
jgi:hypothetical protein